MSVPMLHKFKASCRLTYSLVLWLDVNPKEFAVSWAKWPQFPLWIPCGAIGTAKANMLIHKVSRTVAD